MALAAGTRLGPYEILNAIGVGGMGEVYRARDSRLGRDVAIKVLPEAFARDSERVARFEREAKIVARLNHPNILALFDVGLHTVDGGGTYLVTELLKGQTLRDSLRTGALPMRRALDIAVQIANGLAAAHAQNLVHRDLKPENVFLVQDGPVKILDFGLARRRPAPSSETETADGLTDPGHVMGTLGYMSPEQVRCQDVDPRADLFALGAVVYEMLSGRRAFAGDTAADMMAAILNAEPPDLPSVRPDVSPALERIVRHCLEKNPAERFQSARDLAFAFETVLGASGKATDRVLEGNQPSRHRYQIAAAIGIAGIALVTGAVIERWYQPGGSPSATFTAKTFELQAISGARFMSDGRTIVYSGARQGPVPELFVIRPDSRDSEALSTSGLLLSVSGTDELAVLVDAANWDWKACCLGTLARMNIGGAPRAVLDQVRSADWSPDGASFAVAHAVGGRDHLEYPIGKSLYSTGGVLSDLRISPDGRHVAFVDHPAGITYGSLKVVDQSGLVTLLAGELKANAGVTWTADGSTVVFSPNRVSYFVTGSQAEAVAASGRSPSKPLQQSPGGLVVTDVSKHGSVLAYHEDDRMGMVVKVPGESFERDLSWGESWYPYLSRDGRWIVFSDPVADKVSLRRTDGSRVLQLGPGGALGLSPDGKWALAIWRNTWQLYPTGAGGAVVLPKGPIDHVVTGGGWFPDGRRVLVCGNETSKPARCYEQNISGGLPRPVTPDGVIGFGVALSPDGARLLAQEPDQIWKLVSLHDSTLSAANGLRTDDFVAGWSSDGRAVFAAPMGKVPSRLDRVELQTGNRTLLTELAPPDRAGVVSVLVVSVVDDGRGYAYDYSRVNSTLFLVEGLNIPR